MNQGRITLFSPRQVGIATALGTPLAGLFLIAINYVRIGKFGKALSTLIGGVFLLLILLFVIDIALSQTPGLILFLITVIAMHYLAERLQGKIFIKNISNGGKKSGLLDLWFWSIFTTISFCLFVLSSVFALYVYT